MFVTIAWHKIYPGLQFAWLGFSTGAKKNIFFGRIP